MPVATEPFIKDLNKLFGENVIISASEMVIPRRYTSGSLALDAILGGGFPGNQWTEIIGLESSGKTATVFKTVAVNQALDAEFTTLWVAAEHFDSEQAEALGVDLTRVDVVRTQSMEVAFEAMVRATSSKLYDCIILDSYPALSPDEEGEKGMDELTVGAGAKLMNKFTRKGGAASLRAADGTDRPFFGIIINQWRDVVGGFSKFGVPKITPGGKGKNYFFYTRIEVSRAEFLKEKRPGVTEPIKVGQRIKYLTVKNKSAAPQQVTTVDFYFRGAPFLGFKRGEFDTAKEYAEVGIALGVIIKKGGWYTFAGQQWQGEEKVKAAIRENGNLRKQLQHDVLELASDPHAIAKLEAGADG
jgi:recombination protein RecA